MSNPLSMNCLESSSIVVMSIATILGIASISLTAAAWENLDIDQMWAGAYAGGAFLILALTAYPLAFRAANQYKRQNNTTGGRCWMITSWIIYAIMIFVWLAAIGAGVQGTVRTGFVIFAVLFSLLGWGLMLAYAESSRKESGAATAATAATGTTIATGAAPMPTSPKRGTFAGSSVTTVKSIKSDGTKTTKTVTTHPDGSKTVTITEESADEEMAIPSPRAEIADREMVAVPFAKAAVASLSPPAEAEDYESVGEETA